MKYEYLACDGVNCDKKQDSRKPDLLAEGEPSWLVLATGGNEDFHFCSYDCLKSFTGDDNAIEESLTAYASHFGYSV